MSEITQSNGRDPEHRVAVHADEPIPNPGLPEHLPRPTDVDPAMERRAERQVGAMFLLAAVLAVAFCVCYFTISPEATIFGWGAMNVALGLTLGMSLLLIGLAAIQWARKLMTDHEIIEQRHPTASSPEDRAYS